MKTILGIDPGYGRMGYGVVQKKDGEETLVEAGCFETSSKLEYSKRLLQVGEKFTALFDAHRPDAVAIEKVFFNTNQKTASQIAEVRGLLLYLASQKNIKAIEFSPPEIKLQITGYGRAEKQQVQKMIMQILKLKEVPKPDDKADAIAVALCGINRISTRG